MPRETFTNKPIKQIEKLSIADCFIALEDFILKTDVDEKRDRALAILNRLSRCSLIEGTHIDSSSKNQEIKQREETEKDVEQYNAQKLIAETCDEVREMLLEKNRKYGNSALSPKRIFSKANPIEQINIRIDDKLSRIESSQPDDMEDSVSDLLGYLVLRRVAEKIKKEQNK